MNFYCIINTSVLADDFSIAITLTLILDYVDLIHETLYSYSQ